MLYQLTRRIANWLQTGTEIRRLRQMDDYLLSDMGLERETIATRVRGRDR